MAAFCALLFGFALGMLKQVVVLCLLVVNLDLGEKSDVTVGDTAQCEVMYLS